MCIASVTLQSSNVQGLDDVVIKYSDGSAKCIQIKHSRVGDTLTFGDLVSKGEQKKSLLKKIAVAWQRAKGKWQHCEALLFTNRMAGTRFSIAKSEEEVNYKRPPLLNFMTRLNEELNDKQNISSFSFPQEWLEAWEEWCAQISELEDDEKVEFLKSFVIKTGQPDLSEITSKILIKIRSTFNINAKQAQSVLNCLDGALREWATTRRGTREAITPELVYQKISLSAQESIGEHALAPPYPYFASRVSFLNRLSHELLEGANSIVFLTGKPGIGKTCMVSALANRREPVIDLRFHAYKPITPSTKYLPVDVGETTKTEVLWGDLLSQIRTIFKGRLAKYKVPIRNDFLDANQLREEVLRLAVVLFEERQRPTIIAIDGIDHAARAGVDRHTFLSSLISPENIPQGVRFLIVGQPPEAYLKYPFWLRTENKNITRIEVAGVIASDIAQLLRNSNFSIPEDEFDAAVRLIDSVAGGNTLSAVFAVNEAQECVCIDELQARLGKNNLCYGIINYYDTIWKAELRTVEKSLPCIGIRLAGCLSLFGERITGEVLRSVFVDYGLSSSAWTDILRAIRPLVQEEKDGFRLAHNDVRVHLLKQVQAEPARLREIAVAISDYYLSEGADAFLKHTNLFELLELGEVVERQAQVFTTRYIMESAALGRPISELLEQCKKALRAVVHSNDWNL